MDPKLERLLKTVVLPLIQAELSGNLQAMYVFGSQVLGQTHAQSDLDLAFLPARSIDPIKRWYLQDRIARQVGMEVDLVDLRSASTVMQSQILESGQTLWALQPDAGLFEMMVYTEKTRLDEARAELLNDIQKRGTVYGG